jgi:hypothetical protein
MSTVRKFRASARDGVRRGAYLGLAIVVGSLVALAISGSLEIEGIQRALMISPLVILGSMLLMWAIGKFSTITLNEQGIQASHPLGPTHWVPWNEIVSVNPYSVYGLRMLRLNRTQGHYLVVSAEVDDSSALAEFVGKHAGSDHPLAVFFAIGAKHA